MQTISPQSDSQSMAKPKLHGLVPQSGLHCRTRDERNKWLVPEASPPRPTPQRSLRDVAESPRKHRCRTDDDRCFAAATSCALRCKFLSNAFQHAFKRRHFMLQVFCPGLRVSIEANLAVRGR